MNMKSKAGFTLVELIVVIAILAILAGVAIPAYSGYMTKANEAADTQVLSALNSAFAAACVENNMAPTDFADDVAAANGVEAVTGVSVTVSDAKEITGIVPTTLKTGNLDPDTKAEIEKDFITYFAGNDNTVLKYYTSFSFAGGNFSGNK